MSKSYPVKYFTLILFSFFSAVISSSGIAFAAELINSVNATKLISASSASWKPAAESVSADTAAAAAKDQIKTEEKTAQDPGNKEYLQATKYADSGNADIKELAQTLTKNAKTDKEKAQAIFDFMHKNYTYKYYFNTAAGADEMLSKKEGNGVDFSHLFVALCRSAGLEARYAHALAGDVKGMGIDKGQEYRIYAQVKVDGKWQDADPADKRNTKIGQLSITVKENLGTMAEFSADASDSISLTDRTKLAAAEITAYNRFDSVLTQDGILYWGDASRGQPKDGNVYAQVLTPLTLDEVKDYIKYQDVKKIGDDYYFFTARPAINNDPLTAAEITKYQEYQKVKINDPGNVLTWTLDKWKEYIQYSSVVKDGDKYYWSQDAVPGAEAEAKNSATPDNTVSKPDDQVKTYPADMQKYLKADVNSSAIQAKADQLIKGKVSDSAKAQAIYDWVNSAKSYSYYYNTEKGAVGMLTAGSGNCCDQSHLVVALARAAGLPARYEHNTACTFLDGTFGHVWAQIYVGGKWVDADTVSSRSSFGHVGFTANRGNDRVYAVLPF